MKSWSIHRTGKVLFLVIASIFSIMIFFGLVTWASFKYEVTFIEVTKEFFAGLILFILVWIATFPRWVMNKKIPLKVCVDHRKKSINLFFPKSINKNFNIPDFAFSFHSYQLYSVLVIHNKIVATRGHIIYQEYTSLIGMPIGFGWKKNTLKEISEYLTETGFEYYDHPDRNLFSRILE